MADHLDAPGLMPPGGDPSIDITDVYAFQKPGDASKSIIIMNVNPLTLSAYFNPDAIYEIRVDNNGDAQADVSFRITFSSPASAQTATVRRAEGPQARGRELVGDVIFADAPVSFGAVGDVHTADSYKFFVGKRSDPFFFDLLGFLNNLNFTGADFFVDRNVFGMALEVPNTALGPTPDIGVWARVLVPENGDMTQKDRMGRPAINTVFMKGKHKNDFNRAEPHTDRARFTDDVIAVLQAFGHTAAGAASLAAILLPDILTYNYNNASGFLNGRKLLDDVIDAELNLVSNGAVTSDLAGPHADLLSEFPYMGNPHP